MSPPRAVIFDLDGCLVDSEPLSLEAIASEMKALGLQDATAQEIGDRFLGVAMPDIVDYVAGRLGAPVPGDFAERVETKLLAAYETALRVVPGAPDLLNGLRDRGWATAIATGGSLRRMAVTLDLAGLATWFEGTATSAAEVARGKPAPDLFLLSLDRLHMAARDCIVLEDSPHGVIGARAAGIPAIGFVGGSHLEGQRDRHAAILREAGAGQVFERLDDVKRYILAQDETSD